jgi:hypothetical protein
MQDAA